MATKVKKSNLPTKAASATPSNDKEAKRLARKEAIANRPDGQRQNSKTVDIIPGANGSRVEVYAQPVRLFGSVVTAVAFNADGEIIGTAITTLGGFKVKSKKGHGNLVPGVPGLGKKGKKSEEDADDADDDDDEDEDDAPVAAKPAKESKKKPVKK